MEKEFIQAQGILKNLHTVLLEANHRFSSEFQMQEVRLSEAFKQTYQEYLAEKKWDAIFLEHTTIIISNTGNQIYVANQWFVIASYFVDFCAEMISYRELFVTICRNMGFQNLNEIKDFATKIRSNPSDTDKHNFLYAAKSYLSSEYSHVNDDYDKVASYLWRFGSDYKWWAGNKTIDRHDFFISALLNQMNVVNANSEYLALICLAFASVLKLRILVNSLNGFTINYKKRTVQTEFISDTEEEYIKYDIPASIAQGISISAASLERFKGNIN